MKRLTVFCLLAIFVMALSACGKRSSRSLPPPSPPAVSEDSDLSAAESKPITPPPLPAAEDAGARTRITMAVSHYASMFAESLLRDYGTVDEVRSDDTSTEFVLHEAGTRAGLTVSMEHLPPGEPKAFTADVVLLVRTREDEVAPWKAKGYQELFSGRAVGHNSISVVVDPSCPIADVSLSNLKDVLSGEIKSWDHFGGPARPIRLVYDSWGHKAGRAIAPKLVRPARGEAYTWRAVRALDGDAGALGMVQTTEWLPDTGLRIVRVVSTPDEDKYGLSSDCLSILCRPGAPPAARAFAEHVCRKFSEGYRTRAGAWVAVLGPAEDNAWPEPGSLPAPAGISGAIAVLPIEPSALYFLPLKPDHVAAMESEIAEAIAADRSLTVVDRQELDRVLAERRLAILFERGPAGLPAILAADVLLDSSIVTENHHTYLLIQAIHSATGSRLGWMRLGIDPAKPGEFTPSLGRRIALWWPGVLANLERVRTLPIVTVWGVYPGTRAREEADRISRSVEDAVRGEPRCFLAERCPSVNVQTEALMRIMGLSLACGGSIAPVADYLAEVRMLSDRRAEVRLTRATDRKVLAASAVDGESLIALRAAVGEWFRKQSDRYTTKPPARDVWGQTDDWAREQARREFEAARQMYKELEEDIKSRAVTVAPNTTVSRLEDDDYRRRREIVRRSMLAQQLDPTNEEIARWAVRQAGGVSANFLDCRLAGRIGDRYVASFPPSKPRDDVYSQVLAAYLPMSSLCGKVREESYAPCVPQGLDWKRCEVTYLARTMDVSRLITDRMVRDWRPGMDSVRQPRWVAELFQRMLADYLRVTSAADAAVNEAVDVWAQRYDRLPEIVPPSEFLRLRVLADRKQKKAAATLFVGLVRAHPDPKDRFWTFLDRGSTQLALQAIDYPLDEAAQEWKRGGIPTEELIGTIEKRLTEIPAK